MTINAIQTAVTSSHPAFLPDDMFNLNAQNTTNNTMMTSHVNPPNIQQAVLPPISNQPVLTS